MYCSFSEVMFFFFCRHLQAPLLLLHIPLKHSWSDGDGIVCVSCTGRLLFGADDWQERMLFCLSLSIFCVERSKLSYGMFHAECSAASCALILFEQPP